MTSPNLVVLDFNDAESGLGVRKKLIKSPYVKVFEPQGATASYELWLR